VIEKLLVRRTDNSFIQLFRYTIVGGFALIVDFSLLFIFTDIFGIYYLISAALSFIAGTIVNYVLSIVWVFHKRSFKNKSFEFGIFALIGFIGLGFNELIIWFFTEQTHFHYLLSKTVSAGVVYLWNFFARKFTLFR
jgi:putative flippase GtrA